MSNQDVVAGLAGVLASKGYPTRREGDELHVEMQNRSLGYDNNPYGDRFSMEQDLDAWYRREEKGVRLLAGWAFTVEWSSSYEYGTLSAIIRKAV